MRRQKHDFLPGGRARQAFAEGAWRDAEAARHGSPDARDARRGVPLGSAYLGRLLRAGAGKRFYVKDRGCVPPFTMGHEPFGVVEALGSKAKGVKLGQRRLVFPWIGCGKCGVCKAGQDNYCVSGSRFLGVNRAGAYASHLLVPHPKYLIDSAGIDDGFAATLACSAVTAYSAA